MNNIIKLISEFTEDEYVANSNKYNSNIKNEGRELINSKPKKYFHTIMGELSFGGSPDELEDDFMKQFAEVNKSILYTKRTLFQIKKYQNPVCGNILKRHLKDNILYLCYTSNDEQIEGTLLGYSRVFAVAETDEGIKIIDSLYFYKSKVTYTLSPEDDTELRKLEHVIEPGELLEVKKFQAPIEEESLKDYNQD